MGIFIENIVGKPHKIAYHHYILNYMRHVTLCQFCPTEIPENKEMCYYCPVQYTNP